MNQQIASSASNLKRQLVFLKTIDQKLEGIRRENERLLRLTANPRVVFSRSSLAGLYRIVNSLISAEPMYGLSEIGQWARKNKDWLVELGRRGEVPTQEELDYLLEAANELARLRDEAAAEVEKKLAAAKDKDREAPEKDNAETAEEQDAAEKQEKAAVEEPSDETDAPVETDVAFEEPSPSEKTEDSDAEDVSIDEEFPFKDEPKAQSIKDSSFAPKSVGKKKAPPRKASKGKDRTSTIPLTVDELNMIGTTSMIPPVASLKQKDKGAFWKVFALLSFTGFAVMTGLYVHEVARPRPEPPKTTPVAPEAIRKTPDVPSSPTSQSPEKTEAAQNADKSEAAGLEDATKKAPQRELKDEEKKDNAEAQKDDGEKQENAAAQKDRGKDKEKDKARGKDRRKKDRQREKKASSSSSKSKSSGKSAAAAEPKGILHVKSPADGSAVFVLVDGISKGKTPVRTALSPGLHEVVFTADGKRSMRMIPIKADDTKTVVATKPN